MSEAMRPHAEALQQALHDVERLRQQVQALYQQTHYADLEHADLGLQIVHHALEEVVEHTGRGGHIAPIADADAHRHAEAWLAVVRRLRSEGRALLATHASEDLETALKALAIAEGSLEEVAARYV